MSHLSGNLHVHTTFSDGHLAPLEMAEIYRDLGFDFIAITDHEYMLKPAYFELFPIEVPGIIVFSGIELEPAYLFYHHVLKITGDTETLHVLCHPDQYRITIDEVNRRIALFYEKSGSRIDAVEVTNRGFYTRHYDTPAIPLPKVACDDSHDTHSCGKAWIEVNARPEKDDILRAIRGGDFEIGLLSGKRRVPPEEKLHTMG